VLAGTADYKLADTALARGATTVQVTVSMRGSSLETSESCGFAVSTNGGVSFTPVTAAQVTSTKLTSGVVTHSVVSSGGQIVVRVLANVRSKLDNCYLDSLVVTGLKPQAVVALETTPAVCTDVCTETASDCCPGSTCSKHRNVWACRADDEDDNDDDDDRARLLADAAVGGSDGSSAAAGLVIVVVLVAATVVAAAAAAKKKSKEQLQGPMLVEPAAEPELCVAVKVHA
jgi:hypothetical protein